MRRRQFLGAWAAAGVLAAPGARATPIRSAARPAVIVVGGGFGGATAAKYLRLFSDRTVDVTLIEPDAEFVSCPISNLVVGGGLPLSAITKSYASLTRRHGVAIIRDAVTSIDPDARTVTLRSGSSLRFDKLVLSPGVELMFDSVQGLSAAHAAGRVLQAWKAGAETLALFAQMRAMADGGVFAITVPEAPFRCPAAPYERACTVAAYLKKFKPKSKVLVLDANEDVVATPALFKKAWRERYPGLLEYRGQHTAVAVDAAAGVVKFDFQDDVRADVLNVIPPMRAGALAVRTGLANSNARWCEVDFRSFQSTMAKDIHVIGDSIQTASLMPKSGHMANSHAKAAAAAIVAELAGVEPDPRPMLLNTCYSFVSSEEAFHIASVHAYDKRENTFTVVAGSGGSSVSPSVAEASQAMGWARNIWSDMLD